MNMSVLGISGPPQEIPAAVSERDKSDRKIVVVLICVVIVAFVAVVGTALLVWTHYSAKYANIDKSHETLSWNLDPPLLPSTTYTNPPYGVTLKLPGKWVRVRPPYRCFITLAGSLDSGTPHFDVMFWPIFTGVPSSVDTASSVYQRSIFKRRGLEARKIGNHAN